MSPAILLSIYCLAILAVSVLGGVVPTVVRLTHRRLELALSFVAGVMLGVAMLHLLPHALVEQAAAEAVLEAAQHVGAADHDHGAEGAHGGHAHLDPVVLWMLAGFMVVFLLERYFCFHHHDAPAGADADGDGDAESAPPRGCGHDHHHDPRADHDHRHHQLRWGGAAVGLTLHTLIAGIALAASVESQWGQAGASVAAGFGTFLVIFLHKPADSLTIGTLLAAGGRSLRFRHLVNLLFALVVPVGVVLFQLGLANVSEAPHRLLAAALAFSAGTFLCIALSDLLPELQFHQHDRFKLSLALLLGLAVAWGVRWLEG